MREVTSNDGEALKVRWEDLSPNDYEDMVATLLSILHPDVERIDGSGGDDGRDLQFPRKRGGYDLFELKSYTGRLTSSRRGKVIASLRRAEQSDPKSWALVVPIDPTPDERKWFDNLKTGRQFPLKWRGKTWLAAQMAKYPYLPRYFLFGGRDEAMELLIKLQEEKAGLGRGVPDAVERLQHLAKQLNELDPHYIFDIEARAGEITVGVRPRYLGAEQDRPITIHVKAAFPNTDAGREQMAKVQAAMDFGEAVELSDEFLELVEIDAPAGMGGHFREGRLFIGPPQTGDWRFDGRLAVEDESGYSLAELPVTFSSRSSGFRGGTLGGKDPSGSLLVNLRIDVPGQKFDVNFQMDLEGKYPHEILPVMHFFEALHPPNRVRLKSDLGDSLLLSSEVPLAPIVPKEFVALVEALTTIQSRTHIPFPLPSNFSPQDLQEIRRAERLLSGESIGMGSKEMTFVLARKGAESILEYAKEGAFACMYTLRNPYVARIAGREITLGTQEIHAASVTLANHMQVVRAVEAGKEDIRVRVLPKDSRAEIWLQRQDGKD